MYTRPTFDAHELVSWHFDEASGLKALVAIHAARDGRACGGCRMRPYQDEGEALDDVLRLSRAMSYKAAMAGVPVGGAKAVIIGDPLRDKTKPMLQAMGRLIDRFGGAYISAPDVGIGQPDLQVLRTQTEWVVGVDVASAPYTALGVFVGIQSLVRWTLERDDLAGLRVAVQGLGSVGWQLTSQLAEAGARLVVADLDLSRVEEARDRYGAQPASVDEILFADVDILSPCALGGVLNAQSIPRIAASMVCGAANNQLASADDGHALARHGITYAPDYVVSAGGLIAGVEELTGFDHDAAVRRMSSVGDTLTRVLEVARHEELPESDAADRIAEQRMRSWHNVAQKH
jgi:leucine dehydrogenase